MQCEWHNSGSDHSTSLRVHCLPVETPNSGDMREFGIGLAKKHQTHPTPNSEVAEHEISHTHHFNAGRAMSLHVQFSDGPILGEDKFTWG